MSVSFKHLDPASLPPDWSVDFFGNLVDFKLGKTPPRGSSVYWKEGKYPWVSISDMTPHGIVTETSEKVSQQAYDAVFRGCLVPEGSLLMSFKLTIGRISRLGMPAFHNEAIISFQPDKETLSDDFLGYYLSQINYGDYQDTAIKGKTLNKGKLNSLEIALPPLPEQKKIAHVLSTVQRAIEAQERIIQTTTELKKALMHKLFTEGTRGEPQKQTEIGPVPESWEIAKIGEIAQLKSGGTPSRKNPAYWDGGSINWIKTGEIDYCKIVKTEEKITKAGLEESSAKIFPAGTLLVAMYGQGVTRGKVAITGIGAATNQACAAIFPLAEVRTKYLYYLLEYNYDTIRDFAHGANQKNLSADLIKSFPIAYPRVAGEQKEIADTLGIIDRRVAVALTKKRQLQDLFRTLLHELMTAKLSAHSLHLGERKERLE